MPWQPDQRPTSSTGGLAHLSSDRSSRNAPDRWGLRLGNSIRIAEELGERQLSAWTWRVPARSQRSKDAESWASLGTKVLFKP